jgi:NMD protein affecting ribosome stability and mRNA decay
METCQRCGQEGHDRRSLLMSCFYAMDELNVPFTQHIIDNRTFFVLRVCKDCRASWMQTIEKWFNTPDEPSQPVENGILIRRLGVPVEVPAE